MKALIMSAVAMTALVGGCASTETMRTLQTSAPAPAGKVLFPIEHELRDSVVLDWIGGVSQHSYILAEPNQDVLRRSILRALEDSGLQASTSVRAKYGLRVLVSDAAGPDVGTVAVSRLKAEYTLVERATGREVFKTSTDSSGNALFLGLNESDLRRSTQRSLTLLKIVNVPAAAIIANELAYDVDLTTRQGSMWDGVDYSEWTQSDWNEFWEIYRYASLAAIVYGPASVAVEMANPFNYFPFASDRAAVGAANGGAGHDSAASARASRNASMRAAKSNQRVVSASVTGFLMELSKDQGVSPVLILPCHGSPAVEAAKQQFMRQGVRYTTDSCYLPR